MATSDSITWAELDALRAEWEATFNGDTMPWGFAIGPEQVSMLRECIAKRSQAPLNRYIRSLPKDRVY